jgi:hypothetical protein
MATAASRPTASTSRKASPLADVHSSQKLNAIYNLRTAVEAKVRAEQRLAQLPSADSRAALLHATLEVEERTQTAIEACHRCDLGQLD